MIHKLYLSTILLFVLCACTKNEYITYGEKNGLVFKKGENLMTADSLVFSFITEAVRGDKDTIWIPIALTGMPENEAKKFALAVDENSTAEENRHFKLTEMVFSAGKTEMLYPIILLRAKELETESRFFRLAIKENESFEVGAASSETYRTINIRMLDQVIKPSWWGGAENYYYGVYSHTKYRFMIDVIGISNFAQAVLAYPQIINYRAAFKAALVAYEIEHGEPLVDDESKQAVTFP